MSALLGYGWLDHTAYWAWVAGVAMGAFAGTLLGQWMERLVPRDPLGQVIRAYRGLFADIGRLWRTGRWT